MVTGTSESPGSRLLLFRGYVPSALTPSGIFAMSSLSLMQPLMITPCEACEQTACITQHKQAAAAAAAIWSGATGHRSPQQLGTLRAAATALTAMLLNCSWCSAGTHTPPVFVGHLCDVVTQQGAALAATAVHHKHAAIAQLLKRLQQLTVCVFVRGRGVQLRCTQGCRLLQRRGVPLLWLVTKCLTAGPPVRVAPLAGAMGTAAGGEEVG